LAVVLALAACGSKSDPVAKVKDYADKVCACADAACAKPVWDQFTKFLDDNKTNEALANASWELAKALADKNGAGNLVPPGKGGPSGVPGMDRIIKCGSDKGLM
jgi:hypothetical protein